MAPTLTEQLGTITAIVAVAIGLVEVLKVLLTKYKVGIVASLPMPILCVAVSMGLTLVGNLVLKSLPGQWYDVLWQAALAAGAASGFFSWAKNGMGSPASKLPPSKPLFLLLVLPLVLTSGCTGMSNGQKYILAAQSYATTANTVATLVRAGAFGTVEKAKIKTLNDDCLALLLKMREDLITQDETFDFPYLVTQFQTLLDRLLQMQLQTEATKPKEISSGPNNAGTHRIDGGAEHGLAAGEGGGGMAGDRPRPDAIGDRRSDPGGTDGTRQPERRAEWRDTSTGPAPGEPLVSREVEWD